ncbi:hypothetical protein BDR06DRAFT_1019544 [Suillus hirtellus]|nr:hypothetical protein BDR06DRAFT_1019544 [Suillus hirtellus]
MAATTSTSSYLVDVAMLTDSQSFLVTHIMVDKAVLTEDAELSEGSQVTEGSQVSEGWKSLDGIPCIMGGIQALVASLGGTLHGQTSRDFPWKTLPKELARLGYVLVNYPDKTLMPGELQPTLSRTKGIHDLPQQHRISLINCLKEGTLTIQAVTNDAAHLRLTTSKDPVVIGDVPSACSMHSCGQRAFADGHIDRKGLPYIQQPPSPTSHCHVQVIVEITWPPPRPTSIMLPPPHSASITWP